MLNISPKSVRIITLLLSSWILHAEKMHFARHLNVNMFPLRSHKVVSESVSSCIDKCKASSECNYINYHVTSHLCHLIEGNIGHGFIIEDILEQARGYVFGNKANWTTNLSSGCLSCHGDGKCTLSTQTLKDACPVSGCMPPDSRPGTFTMGNMYDVGNKVKYECTVQFKIAGATQHISTCLESGNWNSTDFQCLLDCGPVPSLEYGSISLDIPGNTTEGAGATVLCNKGYVPKHSQITCQPSGIWETPLCLQTHDFTCRNGSTWEYAAAASCDCVLDCSEVKNSHCLCTEHQERNKLFPKHYISGNNIANKEGKATEKSCAELCRDTPGCRSVDIWPFACYFNNVMPHEVIPGHSETTNLSVRMCDPCN